MKLFICYSGPDEAFAASIAYALRKQSDSSHDKAQAGDPGENHLDCYFYPDSHRGGSLGADIDDALRACDGFVFIAGATRSEYQLSEAKVYCESHPESARIPFVVQLPGAEPLGTDPPALAVTHPIELPGSTPADAERAAKAIVERLFRAKQRQKGWVPLDGIPIGYPFSDEKAISDEFRKGGGKLDVSRVEFGCTLELPEVIRLDRGEAAEQFLANPLQQARVGLFRNSESKVVVDARVSTEPEQAPPFHFLEAGPRNRVRYPLPKTLTLRVGVIVSGGIAPGINAVIDGIVTRHRLYEASYKHEHSPENPPYLLEVIGYRDGFNGLLRPGSKPTTLWSGEHPIDTRRTANDGGSILSTGRADVLLDSDPQVREAAMTRIIDRLDADDVSILYVIGGDGSMRAAHAIHSLATEQGKDISVIAIPKTMDNDILWVWQSFGFLSAVEHAKKTVQQLNTEATSNPRLGVVQLFGSDSGFVVSHAAIGSGVSILALIPEVGFTMEGIWGHVREQLLHRLNATQHGKVPHGIILMAETAIPQDFARYINDERIGLTKDEKKAILAYQAKGSVVHGQTPDALRTGGLRMVCEVLRQKIRELGETENYFQDFRVFSNEPRHMIRAMAPSVSDVIFGNRLGTLAVDSAMAGYRDFMISNWLTEFVLVPLPLVVLGRKRVRKDGIFWKTVLASTGQPPQLTTLPSRSERRTRPDEGRESEFEG